MSANPSLDAQVSIAACRALVATASIACDGDTAIMMSALIGAIVVVAASRPCTAALLEGAIAGLESARSGRVAESVRAVVATEGQPS